eukprot:Plantae.Rhodophyta-Purpureofilum_apyrenoidigerum.ctg22950.p1 GENE.Plantae.Rhodophyta-Purpureofilum_apyrenoidigerum.ctg22950~~Plantae.Rhodophyta-Purpureofilum_apyrenoidigerum.ctg22950.p1  ORF type:complete len:520 (+),score=70.67 Plantae.Rhodophyta-Purpureofilum_apyrenoidigerum.ctg22950:131-1561(+)
MEVVNQRNGGLTAEIRPFKVDRKILEEEIRRKLQYSYLDPRAESVSEESLADLVHITSINGSSMTPEEKSRTVSYLRRLCYTSLMPVEWHVPPTYDYTKSTMENYAAKSPDDMVAVGQFADVRSNLDESYHGRYIASRQAFQDMLVQSVVRCGVQSEHPWIIFTAGPMGAGKSHTLQWMSEREYFPIKHMVQLDPDKFKSALPEWDSYVKADVTTAGIHTQRESGLLVEIGQAVAMRAMKNIWIDGSFRDGSWYEQVFDQIREHNPEYRIAIIYVHASREIVLERARKRADETGRYVPDRDIEDSLTRVPEAVARLAPKADFVANIDNSGKVPRLTGWSTESGRCHFNICGSFEEISKRLITVPKERSCEDWKNFLTKMILRKKVLLFTKSYCCPSNKLKALLQEANFDFTQVQLDEGCFGGPVMRNILRELTEHKTVPLLFVQGQFVGGYDEAQTLYDEGRLEAMYQNGTPGIKS